MTAAMIDTLGAIGRWRDSILDDVADQPCGYGRHPLIDELGSLAAEDAEVGRLVSEMVLGASGTCPDQSPVDFTGLLLHLNAALCVAPGFVPPGARDPESVAPFASLLSRVLATPAGIRAYQHGALRSIFKRLLEARAGFLRSPESRYVLNDGPRGWQSPAARDQLDMDSYVHQETEPYWGFQSWHDFFTRDLRHGARPVSMPTDDKVVVSACDAVVAKVSRRVNSESLTALIGDGRLDEFVGGDLWQSEPSPTGYQHWHSPVAGTIRDVSVADGLYCGGQHAQIQTRALTLIEADDPTIGLVAVLGLGVDQVASCSVEPATLEPGAFVHKGDRLGAFASGGSTHSLLFRRGAIRQFAGVDGDETRVGQAIALADS